MALTIAIDGLGVIANADGLSDSAGGTWTEQGGGSISLSNDVFLFNGASIGGKYASKSGFHQYAVPTTLDFSVGGGTHEGQLIYMWVSMTAIGTLDTISTGALAIRISSSSPGTSNYSDFVIAGNDDANGWTGGWKCFVLDPTTTPTREDAGATDLSAITTIGIWIDCSTTARADSIFVDQIVVGNGLRVTGTSTTGWLDVVNYCTDYAVNRAWGMFTELDGIYFAQGKTFIGDSVNQSAAVSFADSGRIIQYAKSQYYNVGGSWVSMFDISDSGVVVEDIVGFPTTFTDGVIVGTDNGRSGSVIIGNTDQDISFDLYGGNNAGSVTSLYGTTIKSCYGVINFGDDADHKILGVSFIDCAQINPVGAPFIRNCTFAETAATTASLLWNESMDIAGCAFIANTTGAGIQHPSSAGTPYTHTGLTFSGNTNDVNNTSGSAIIISNVSSDGSTSTGSGVTFETAATLTVGGVRAGSDVWIYKQSDKTLLESADPISVTDGAPVDGIQFYKLLYTYNASVLDGTITEIKVYSLGFENIRQNYTLTTDTATVGIQQRVDRNYDNP
jgi:hypothetical protein